MARAAGDLGVAARDRRGRRVRPVHPERHHRSATSGSPRRQASWRCANGPALDARIFYRHRPKNIARKSGNIAEWVTRFGGAYAQFLILDADSLMTGETLVRLAGAMERHPDVGLIQTLPIITGATTLFARVQQFAGRVYGPLIAHGHRLVARRRGQLLGPQRDHPHPRLRRAGGAAGTGRAQAVRRADHEPRLRRGRADAARRLGGAHGARRARQLRGGAADADRPRGARPALVPGQSAAPGGAAGARACTRSAGCIC